MNATKFVVFFFIGVVCANVGARQFEEVSEDKKLGIYVPKTATSNNIGAELDSTGITYASTSNVGTASAENGPDSASADGTGSDYSIIDGYITVSGPQTTVTSSSGDSGQGQAGAAAGPGGAASNGTASGGGGSFVTGSSEPSA